MTRWYRAYVGTVNDPKLAGIAIESKTSKCIVIAIWHFILERAAEANAKGKYKMDGWQICGTLDLDIETVKSVWACLIKAGMLTEDEVVSWKKRQYETDIVDPTNAERQRRWKEKHLNNGTVTHFKRPDTDTDTDTKKKEDILVEKRTSDEEEFERFWKAYPKRKGSNPKQLAKTKFISAVHKEILSPAELVAAAGAYADEQQSMGKIGTEFVAQAATWLNQQRYLDYRKSNGDGTSRAPLGLSPEQKKVWIQEEMRKFREENNHVESD